jgi:hypothetical protein
MDFFKDAFYDIRTAPNDISMLIHLREKGLDFDVFMPTFGINLQRPLVWEKDAIEKGLNQYHHHRILIESIFGYNDIGRFVIHKKFVDYEPYLIYQVVDGKQRINAIYDFIDNKFGVIRGGIEYFYRDIPIRDRRRFQNTIANVAYVGTEHTILSDQDLVNLFLNTNIAGVPQDSNHIQKLLSL